MQAGIHQLRLRKAVIHPPLHQFRQQGIDPYTPIKHSDENQPTREGQKDVLPQKAGTPGGGGDGVAKDFPTPSQTLGIR